MFDKHLTSSYHKLKPYPRGYGYRRSGNGHRQRSTIVATNGKYDNLPEAKKDALKRLSYIEGHLSGIRRMVEEDKYCVDVLKQTFAVRRAILKLEARLLKGHLHSCVIEGVKEGREDEVLGELLELYSLSDKR
ncbi:MAG: metal-sensitive transcriptional regulator [Chloroflexi bacterium]|nr:metal-sensitive transcriptional regulator [Chloroflexota bacterium]